MGCYLGLGTIRVSWERPQTLPSPRGASSYFRSKNNQNCISPPTHRHTLGALWNAKESPNYTRSIANHGSLSKATPFGVRNRPGVAGTPPSPPFRARREQAVTAGNLAKCHEFEV